jgi:hypothetical protein
MAPEQPVGRPAGPAGRSPLGAPRRRLRWLFGVIVVMILLTAGWPLINSTVVGRHNLSPGAMLTVGPGKPDAAQITVGRGWSVLTAESNPRFGFSLRHGAVRMTVDYVALANAAQARQLWAGLRRLLRVTEPGLHLSAPVAVVSAHGHPGLVGKLTGARRVGTAAIFTDPSRKFAIEMVMLAPRSAGLAVFLPGRQIIRSVRLLTGGGS